MAARRRANGGDVIIARSIYASVLLFLVYISFKQVLDPARTWNFSVVELRIEVYRSLPAFGAILAAVYATLYARFSAQWHYLAGLYNEILKADIAFASGDNYQQEQLACWKASFIEDADELHLSTKRIFVPTIKAWLGDKQVQVAFVEGALGGATQLETLQRRLQKVHPR